MAAPFTVYALSCKDGPPVYVGSTEKPLQQRIDCHWHHAKKFTRPLQVWLNKLESPDDLTITTLATVSSSLKFLHEVELLKVERTCVYEVACRVLRWTGIVTLNTQYSPFRTCGGGRKQGVNDVEINRVLRNYHNCRWSLAEDISPYQHEAVGFNRVYGKLQKVASDLDATSPSLTGGEQ